MAIGQGKTSSKTIKFPHFDVASDESDHYYIKSNQSNNEKNCFNDTNTSTYRTIMKEWKILEKNLPESIYVRTYELRLDLLRAVIIGAPGTPYHDGLFFFDIVFPSDYPNHPPKIHHLSRGFRMNPNLYSNGFVCLSLANTWSGTKVERWTPTNSTILQLLVSIQGLVLNSQPYFNEPGREKHIKSETWLKRSLAYNEEVLILTCKLMICHIRTPPKNFEGFVHQYFGERGEFILTALNAYSSGKARSAGQYQGDNKSSSRVYSSAQFKKNSRKMFAELESALKKAKEPATNNRKMKNASSKAKVVEENKPKSGFMQKIKDFFKIIFE